MVSSINCGLIHEADSAKWKTDCQFTAEERPLMSAASKVLIVEDHQPGYQYLEKILTEKISFPVRIFNCRIGIEALEVCRDIKPDLIVIDISMPNMNGIKLARQIWLDYPTMRILFWTQYHRETHVRELAKIVPDEAVHGYVVKTESDEKLIDAVQSLLLYDSPYIDAIARSSCSGSKTSGALPFDIDTEILHDLVLGLTELAIARRHNISIRGVESRVQALAGRLLDNNEISIRLDTGFEIYNRRNRLVFEAFKRKLIQMEDLELIDTALKDWIHSKQEEQNLLA